MTTILRAAESDAGNRQQRSASTPSRWCRRKSSGAAKLDVKAAANFAIATKLSILLVDAGGLIRFVNHAVLELFGYGEGEMVGRPVEIIIPERLRSAHANGFARAMAGEKLRLGGKSVEVYALRKDGTEFPIELTLCAWRDERGVGAGAVIKDITDRRERERRLLRLASQDVLTGLHNRNRFLEIVGKGLEAGQSASIIMVDIQGFKDVNAVHSHGVGDCLLQAVAVRLLHVLPPEAEVARFGGDEFAVFLPNVGDIDDASTIAESLFSAFRVPFEVGGQLLDIGVSAGLAASPIHGGEAEELAASADFALNRARGMRGRALTVYDPAMRNEVDARRALLDELLRGLRRGELVLHYQPQVHMHTGEIFGLEALIRWNHPERGLLLPGAFLPALEQSSLALEIGWWTLDQACRDAAALGAEGHVGMKMGVNLFPGQLHSPNICMKVTQALARYGLRPDLLELEVTETTALHDDDRSLEAMTALREIGVGIAFDDFGTGYASLSSLQRYPLTTLKIDRAFVRDLMARPRDVAITRALIGMSRDLGLETIAEGIETAEQESLLVALGCPAAQGYRYGKPMPFAGLQELLSEPILNRAIG